MNKKNLIQAYSIYCDMENIEKNKESFFDFQRQVLKLKQPMLVLEIYCNMLEKKHIKIKDIKLNGRCGENEKRAIRKALNTIAFSNLFPLPILSTSKGLFLYDNIQQEFIEKELNATIKSAKTLIKKSKIIKRKIRNIDKLKLRLSGDLK